MIQSHDTSPQGGIEARDLVKDYPGDIRALDGVSLAVAPGSIFGHPGNHFRIGLGRTGLPAALERLEAFAERTLA